MTVSNTRASTETATDIALARAFAPEIETDRAPRALFEHMSEGLAYCRIIIEDGEQRDFEFLAVNAAFQTQTGLTNVVGRRASEVVPGIHESNPDLLRAYARVALDGVPERFETFVNALQLWFSMSVYSPKKGFFVMVFDVINDRKQAEKALRESEEALRTLFDDAPFAYHEIDREGIVLRVNRMECQLLGVKPSEMVGRPIWDFVRPEEREQGRASMKSRLLGTLDLQTVERTFVSRDGGEFVFQIHSRRIVDSAGNTLGLRSSMIDVTEARRLNARLAEERQLLRALMDQSPDHIYFKDAEGRFTLVNAAVARQMGASDPSQLVGKTDFDFFSPEHAAHACRDERDLVHGRVPMVSREEKETFPDGRETWAFTTKLPLRDAAGKITGTFGISRDITERRRIEKAYSASEDRLKLALEALNLGTWDLDLRTDRAECSERLLQLYGRSGTSLDSAKWAASLHPHDLPAAVRDLNLILQTGEASNRRFRVIWPDGSIHWLHSICRVLRDAEGRPARVIGMDFDVTEHALSEERVRILSTAVEQSPVSIIITNLRGEIEYVNSKVTEITGYTSEELIGQNPRVMKSGETSAEEYRNLWRTIQTGEWRGTLHNRKKNGELFWEAAVIRPIRDSDGLPTHYLAVKENITAQRAAEEALRISEERFRIAAESAGDMVFEWDLATGALFFPGKTRDQMFPSVSNINEWVGWIHPDDLAYARATARVHISQHTPLHQEYRIFRKDGGILHIGVQASVLGNPENGYKSIGVITNITERKAAERANAELAAIVESADTAIYSRDLCGKVLTWNAGAERIYGYRPEEMIGRSLTIIFPADRIGEERMINDTLQRGERILHMETARLTKAGEQIPILLSASPVLNRAGEVIGTAHVAVDVTEQKLLQQQLAQAQKLESIGQLAAGIAHEINTPIQYIGDNAQFLSSAFQDLIGVIRNEQPASEADIEYLRSEIPGSLAQLQEGVERVTGIVRAMKRFSHPGPAERIPMDINQAIESTILVSRHEWKYVAELTTEFQKDLPLVPCVAGEFNQVILNLIVNAAHAIADVVKGSGGKGSIRIGTRRIGDLAEVRVSDTGCGIPEAIRRRVFDPFFTTKPVGKGTGQGLAIAHTVIAQKHKGTIEFQSEIGKGTTFVIRLPLIEKMEEK